MLDVEEHKLLRAFLEESEELLEKLSQALLQLEREPANLELVHEIFRLTHSLKSESALIGFANLSELAHRLEDVFERIRSGVLALRQELLDVILSAADLIHEMVSRITHGEGDGGVEFRSLVRELSRLAGIPPGNGGTPRSGGTLAEGVATPLSEGSFHLSASELARVRDALERGESFYELDFRPEGEPTMKYPRAYLVLSNLEQAANVLKAVPDLGEPGEEDLQYSRVRILFSSELPEQELARCFEVDQVAAVELRRLPEQFWVRRAGGQAEPVEEAQGPSSPAEPPGGAEQARSRIERSSVRVDTRKLDELWQLVGELVNCKARYSMLAGELASELRLDLEKVTDTLERVTSQMQQAVMQTRVVPISVLFNKFPRLVRDLSRKLGKSVELELHGRETEIDRSLVEALSDPLTHLIRNSLDHGIETVEERLALGKPPTGRVVISAQQRGGKIVMEVSDDGKGLDFELIRRKAQAAPEATDEELTGYIFLPGFSTREDVTELSGRGVGMDVVATRIRENLKGEVLVASSPGQGLTITIILPLTLTILHSLIVRLGRSYYAIPIQDIEETLQVETAGLRQPLPNAPERLPYGELDLAAVRLSALFRGSYPAEQASETRGVILAQKGRNVCLLVDEVVEEQDVVVKPIAEVLNPKHLFSGVSVLGDGRIAFLLDTARIIELTESIWQKGS
jgi:two-component system chemotaxis sensor kinase CheA